MLSTPQTIRQTFGGLVSLFTLLAATSLTVLPTAHAQTGECKVTREQVLEDLKAGLSDVHLARKYAGCKAADPQDDPAEPRPDLGLTHPGQFTQVITNTGSTFWESLTGCGYHPQRKELTCPIEIRQRWGYGGPPAIQPAGSFEYVQFCVQYGGILVPVNVSGVHLHDEIYGVPPNWYMTAVIAADGDRRPDLFTQPLNGRTLRARAILSWAINPFGNCNFVPIWGNQADFHIRLDP